ncbi:MAG: RagB/SusD family nutrient uptake outer membrane protein [Cytophagales bacterium]|uniref:RagB/SusD family nutrient uptake outer membrane protein n=1 Tax=Cyclobacterium marinum TaxID=104 RepID=UPI0030DC4F73|nr:RagB/SusD family nutrient uptake outer membrane protein [Cytophagales bacterium]|tara:strand:+ start:55873 stop:57414 length:1542 start_codon:yes stop_codon:yes gene_type:complete
MRNKKYKIVLFLALILGLGGQSCTDLLDEPLENKFIAENTDYTQFENMDLLLYGAYNEFYSLQWESFPIISVRGDDVNAGGDQVPLTETDNFQYNRSFWMYNSTWLNLYSDLLFWHGAMEEIEKYREAGANEADARQYIAEIKVLRAYELMYLAKLWGSVLIPSSSEPSHLFNVELSDFDAVMDHISLQMDEAIPDLPSVHPNQRSKVRGGVTRYTALAVKALANLEMKNYPEVVNATDEIIGSGLFTLEPDYYQLFKLPGKLNDENLLELQYSDFGQASGTNSRYLWDFFGPANWTPTVAGAGGGWGFWEPSLKYVKFMLDRNEQERLSTTVLFTPDGIAEIQADPAYSTLPNWVSNSSEDGDVFNNHPRYNFLSGKHYLPSTQLTPGRFSYGENKNFTCIRYAEILLIHAEALVSGASGGVITADEAVNLVRNRSGLGNLSGVDLDSVLDEKFAEFGMEWGIRYYDLVRHDKTDALNYGGRTYDDGSDRFLPYPLEQQDILPQIKEAANNN